MTALRAVTRSLQGWHLDSALCTSVAASVAHTALGSHTRHSRHSDDHSFFACHSVYTGQHSALYANLAHHSRLQLPSAKLHANLCECTSQALARASLSRTFSSRIGGTTHPFADDEQQADDTSTAECTPIPSSPDSGTIRSTEIESQVDTEPVFVYHGPLSHTLLRLKVGAPSNRLT